MSSNLYRTQQQKVALPRGHQLTAQKDKIVQFSRFLSIIPSDLPRAQRWAISNLVALLRWNLFTYRDLWKWIDDPYAHAPPEGDLRELHFFLDSTTQP